MSCSSTPTLRLTGFLASDLGRLEVLRNGVWGTVSSTLLDNRAAIVVCRQLGFPFGHAWYTNFTRSPGDVMWMDNVTCSGLEADLESCAFAGWGVASPAAVPVGVTCDRRKVRLRSTDNSYSGLLEVFVEGQWGTVCNNAFGFHEAALTCSQLGFLDGYPEFDVPDAAAISGDLEALLDLVTCSGSGAIVFAP